MAKRWKLYGVIGQFHADQTAAHRQGELTKSGPMIPSVYWGNAPETSAVIDGTSCNEPDEIEAD